MEPGLPAGVATPALTAVFVLIAGGCLRSGGAGEAREARGAVIETSQATVREREGRAVLTRS